MIEDLSDVTGDALTKQIAFLAASPVSESAGWLEAGTHVLRAGVIKSNTFLGDQVTIFGNLDNIWAKSRFGREKFLVKHVRGVLLDPKCGDAISRERLLAIERAMIEGSLTPNITLLTGEPPMVIDGNKSAAAFHHLHKADEAIELRVFVVAPK